ERFRQDRPALDLKFDNVAPAERYFMVALPRTDSRRAGAAGGNMMFRSAWASFCLPSRSRLLSGSVLLLSLLCVQPLSAQVIAQYGFEDGTVQGWTSFNGASAPVNSTAAAHGGAQSLLTTTNSSGGGGPG